MRKLILLLIASLLVYSCATPEYIEGRNVSYSLDLKPYSDKGFFISPYEYTQDFKMIGVINYELMPDIRKVKVENLSKWIQEPIKTYQILDSVYNVCNRMGANALIDFKISPIVDEYVFEAKVVKVYGLKVTGYAIDRQ